MTNNQQIADIDSEIQAILNEANERIEVLLEPYECDFNEELAVIWVDNYQQEFYIDNEEQKELEHKKECEKWLSYWKNEDFENATKERKAEILGKIEYWSREND